MIKAMSVEYQIKELCEALGVSRSGYYGRQSRPEGVRGKANRELTAEVRAIDREHKQRYGSPRMTRELHRRGHGCGENRVARIMKEEGLRARSKQAFRSRTTQAGTEAAPNHLAAMDAPGGRDEIWVSDITYIATREGWLYLAVVLDLYSRRVLGWKLGLSLEASLVHAALARALEVRQPPLGFCFHSDRGAQYGSELVKSSLEALRAIRSMSAKGNCYDNATMEAFWSSLKTECLPPGAIFDTREQARREIFEYIEGYYDSRRLHSSLGYLTPQEYEAGKEPLARRASGGDSGHAASEDRAMRGRTPSAEAASQTAGSADPGVSLPGEASLSVSSIQSDKSQGFGDRVPIFTHDANASQQKTHNNTTKLNP
jgi:putative transposase